MFLNTIDDLLDFFLAQVSCGGHFAESCPDCPQGNGASWCNGDCKWLSGQCIDGNFNSLVGDGFCNDGTNNPGCLFDGGDCCGTNVNTVYCADCICYSHDTCDGPLDLISDGYCNDETNNAGCNFDGGDCIPQCDAPELVANGYCNDETNKEECVFDGGDCCSACANTDQCSYCVCHEGGAPGIDTSCKYSRLRNNHRATLINFWNFFKGYVFIKECNP
jgi:hypothetical protein